MDGNPSETPLSDQIRTSAINEVSQTHKNLAKTNPEDFIRKCHESFCRKKLEQFPQMCEVARVQNILKWNELYQIGNKGKYTDSYGWSPNGTMRFQFEIPQDLYQFMQNLVYDGFWEAANKKIADRFMNRICKGENPSILLTWVRSHYGTEQGKVTSHGF